MGFNIKAIMPWIGAAVATALPGPLGAAALAVGKALGGNGSPATIEPTVDAISNAVQSALGDPSKVAALRAQDDEFKLAWQAAGFKQESDLEALGNEDRKDARSREIAVRDYTPEVGFYLLSTVFGLVLRWLMKYPVPADNKAIIYSAVGILGTLMVMAATYFYGTNSSSARKTELLAQAPAIPAK